MISPDQVDRLQDQHDKFSAMIMIGCLLFFVGGALAVFASQEFATGTTFMQHLAGAEQGLGAFLILVGWVRIRSVNAELERQAPPITDQSTRLGAGH
jgi:hypothetical protein